MSSSLVSRRRFLETVGLAASTTLVGSFLLQARQGNAASSYTRRDIGTLSTTSSTVLSYKKAIAAMKALSDDNPLSWTYQAAIHGTTLPGSQPAWNTCKHGTYFFFSWHRMYLWYFERIVRKLSGDSNWALPYWNYGSTRQRRLPTVFRSPANASNPLYVTNRGSGWNAGTSSLNASAVDTVVALAEVPFNDFSSSLEGTPHGAVHVSIGGLMGSVPTAAQDPIFWLHHCNIDRLWNIWLAQGGGRTDPLSDSSWTTTKFTFFDENGQSVQLTGCEILRAQEQLNYAYQGEPTQVKLSCQPGISPTRKRSKEVLLRRSQESAVILPPESNPVSVGIDVRPVREQLLRVTSEGKTNLTLDLTNIEADRQPDVYYEVYVGLPKGATPEFNSPFYVGNIALFGQGIRNGQQHGEFSSATLSFKINRAVSAFLRRNQSDEQLNILFVPRGASPQENQAIAARSSATIQIGGIAISSDRQP